MFSWLLKIGRVSHSRENECSPPVQAGLRLPRAAPARCALPGWLIASLRLPVSSAAPRGGPVTLAAPPGRLWRRAAAARRLTDAPLRLCDARCVALAGRDARCVARRVQTRCAPARSLRARPSVAPLRRPAAQTPAALRTPRGRSPPAVCGARCGIAGGGRPDSGFLQAASPAVLRRVPGHKQPSGPPITGRMAGFSCWGS